MKAALFIFILFFSIPTFAQADTGDCRAKVKFLTYNNGKYRIEITNKSTCPSGYYVKDPHGVFVFDTFQVRGLSSRIVEFAAPMACGQISIIPDEYCKTGGMKCALGYVYTDNVCTVLPVGSTGFFPYQAGNYLTGSLRLTTELKTTDKVEVEMVTDRGTVRKPAVLTKGADGLCYYSIQVR